MAPNNPNEYIGSRLVVITKSGIRYEGTLCDLDQQKATVSLADVKVHGTEGRGADLNRAEVPAYGNVFKYLMFRGNDISDLVVVHSPQDPVHDDPAVIAVNIHPKDVANMKIPHHFQDSFLMDSRRRNLSQRIQSQYRRDGGILGQMVNSDELKKECENDYDFVEANKNVDKEKIAEEMNQFHDKFKVIRGYKPEKGFYDDISNDLSWSRNRSGATLRSLI